MFLLLLLPALPLHAGVSRTDALDLVRRWRPITYNGQVLSSERRIHEYTRAVTCLHTPETTAVVSEHHTLHVVHLEGTTCTLLWTVFHDEACATAFRDLRAWLAKRGYTKCRAALDDDVLDLLWNSSFT